jgi:hypothetical protein
MFKAAAAATLKADPHTQTHKIEKHKQRQKKSTKIH